MLLSMKKIEREIINSFNGLTHIQVMDMTNILKGILYDTLNQASKEVYNSGVDRDVLIKVYNAMMAEFKKK